MKSTEELKAEHVGIKTGLKILEEMCSSLERGEKVEVKHLEDIASFIKEFADRCHHAKEETVLFPEMEKAGIPRQGGPIGVMLAEHDTGRAYVKAFTGAIAAYKAGDKGASRIIIENARLYVELLRNHIQKEDEVLYPMAEKFLKPPVDAEMMEKFEKIENEKMGKGRHEEFHSMLERLEGEYLNPKTSID